MKHLFISHSWTYKDQYKKLVNLLNNSRLEFKNYSVPKDDPIHTKGTKEQLRSAIAEKIRNCHIVLVVAGVYSSYSKWINIEIEIAKNEWVKSKPIIAIEPSGSQHTSQHVKDNADEIVGWNTNSIVEAINKLT